MREIAYRVREQVVPQRLPEGEFFIILRDDRHFVFRGSARTGICFRATDTIWFHDLLIFCHTLSLGVHSSYLLVAYPSR